jgi:hypothetical protein
MKARHTLAHRHGRARTLATSVRLNDLRRNRYSLSHTLLASLTPLEDDIFRTVANGGSVFGGTNSDRIVLSVGRRDAEPRVIDHGMAAINELVRHGWLRFARMTGERSGWFWLTNSAERLWNETKSILK